MSNTVIRNVTDSSRRYIYVIWLILLIGFAIIYGASIVWDFRLDQRISDKQVQLDQVEAQIRQTGSEKAFFSYKFAEQLVKQWDTKWSQHITALVEVLKQVQSNDYVWANAIELSDFTISPTTLSLKWRVSNLILLYYSSPEKWYTSLIDRFASLPFISNISIKKYNKIWDYYEFTLDADINPNAIIQQQTNDTNEQWSGNQNSWTNQVLSNSWTNNTTKSNNQ